MLWTPTGCQGKVEELNTISSSWDWMCPMNKADDKRKKDASKEEEECTEPKGDPEMAPYYLKRLLPVFAQTFQQTMLPSIRKASLALIRKMVHYSSEVLLREVCESEIGHNLPTVLVEITATVLDQEDDDDGHLLALQIIRDLVDKDIHYLVLWHRMKACFTVGKSKRMRKMRVRRLKSENARWAKCFKMRRTRWVKHATGPLDTPRRTSTIEFVNRSSEFVTGWTGKRGRKLKSKLEKTKQKVKSMARELYDDHFKAVESMPRGVVVTLRNIATQLESAWELHVNRQCLEGENTWRDLMKTALENLIVVLKDENTISPYEMCSSGLVQALFTVLSNSAELDMKHDCKPLMERINVFKAAFSENEDNERRLRFRLERAPGETALIDRTGRMLKMEPLATVESLEQYLLKMVKSHSK
ncbi:hypothetical protein XENOCAPTIV_024380, partial [Xenoophorus captivus]